MDLLLEQLTGTRMDSLFYIPGVRLVGVVEIVNVNRYIVDTAPLKPNLLVFMNNHVHRALLDKGKKKVEEKQSTERNSTYIYTHIHRHTHTCTHASFNSLEKKIIFIFMYM